MVDCKLPSRKGRGRPMNRFAIRHSSSCRWWQGGDIALLLTKPCLSRSLLGERQGWGGKPRLRLQAALAQLAEARALKPLKSGFESLERYCRRKVRLQPPKGLAD